MIAAVAWSVALVVGATRPASGAEPGPPGTGARAAIEQVALDYVEGQLEGNAARVARALHPDLAKRAVASEQSSSREMFPLRRMSADELIELTARGSLKTPKSEWQREVKLLDVTGNAAAVRVETPWFVDYFHMARFGQRWLIVNALWWPKPIQRGDGRP